MRTLGLPIAVAAVLLVSASAARAEGPQGRLGIGIRSTGQTTAGDHDPENALHLDGGGVQVRYRAMPRLSVELTIEGLRADLAGGNYVRDSVPVTLSALFHLTPARSWNAYLVLGVGSTESEVTFRDAAGASVTQSFSEAQVHFGGGVERRIRQLGIGAELRFVGLTRSSDAGAGADYGTIPYGPVAASSAGGQINLTLTYYFL